MEIAGEEFQNLVESLLGHIRPQDFDDAEWFRMARELNALPVGYDLFVYVFLKPDGEVIDYDFLHKEFHRANDFQRLIRVLVWAAERYPQFEKFIPAQPVNAEVCKVCNGTKLWLQNSVSGQPMRCVICGGLGWTLGEDKK